MDKRMEKKDNFTEIDTVFFDLFFTLVTPTYGNEKEYEIVGLSLEDWELHAECSDLYLPRSTGKLVDPMDIVREIIKRTGVKSDDRLVEKVLHARVERFRNILLNIDSKVLHVLEQLRRNGKRLCLISNADPIDIMFWEQSPLKSLFDEAIFSCQAGCVKPNVEIYELALQRMDVRAAQCAFVGDGGSQELAGAKCAGMRTVMTEYFLSRDQDDPARDEADFCIQDFSELIPLLSDK